MDYESQLRTMLLRYPHRADEIKIYIDPELSGCCRGCLNDLDTLYKEVDTPEEADYIPVWLDYKFRCSKEVLDFVEKYPDKCLASFNYLQAVNAEMDEMDHQTKEKLVDLLSSVDWECIYLGLTLIRHYYLTDQVKNLVKLVIDTVRRDSINGTGTIIPLGKEEKDRIEIDNLDIICEYMVWLHNEMFIL